MFKLTYRNYIKMIIACFLICVFISGCSRYVKEETTQIIEIKDKGQQDKKAQPEENQKEKLSKMYNWDNARIPTDWYRPNFGEGQILQNQEYIFFPEDGNKVVRINKLNGQKKTICEFDFIEEKFIHYCLSEDGIFVEYNSNIYFCDFDGENMHKIISRKNLKEQITAIKKDGWHGGVVTLYFYKDNLFMVSYYYMWKLDLTTKKIMQMSKDTTMQGGCFCGNSLYYVHRTTMIYKTDIDTGKSTRIMGTNKEWSKENSKKIKYYYALTAVDGKIYYVQTDYKHHSSIWMYREGKKDKKIYDLAEIASVYSIKSDSGKIAFQYEYDPDDGFCNITIYDIKSSTASKIKKIKNGGQLVHFADDMIFYAKRNTIFETTSEYLLYKSY